MSDSNIKNIPLAFQCPQNWDAMRLCEGGKFCTICQKTVFDFTNKNQADFDKINQQFEGKICGRFHKSQLHLAKMALMTGLVLTTDAGLKAQHNDNQPFTPIQKDTLPSKNKETDFFIGVVVEQMAHYKNGEKAFFQFLIENIRYPKDSAQGTVFLGFSVGVDGHLKNMVVKKGIKGHPSFEIEAIRVLQLTSGNWVPGKQQGKVVETQMTMPIKFRME